MPLELVATRIVGEQGPAKLVYADGCLVCVLLELVGPDYGNDQHLWYMEAGFGPMSEDHQTFATLEEATRFIESRMMAPNFEYTENAS